MRAVWKLQVVELLLDAKADVTVANKEGDTALLHACANGNDKTARMLLQAGSDMEKTGDGGTTTLMSACRYGHVMMVRTLLALGAKPNTVDAVGMSALMNVCQYEQELDDEILTVLLQAGASPNLVRSSDGSTALHISADARHDEATTQLLKAKADPDAARKDGFTPLTIAASNGHESILGLLLDGGAAVDRATLNDGLTPLHCAALHGHVELVRRLLSAGASAEARTKKKQTPYDLAEEGGTQAHKACAAKLKEAERGLKRSRRSKKKKRRESAANSPALRERRGSVALPACARMESLSEPSSHHTRLGTDGTPSRTTTFGSDSGEVEEDDYDEASVRRAA